MWSYVACVGRLLQLWRWTRIQGHWNRQEWLQCLVRIAIMRYVIPHKIGRTCRLKQEQQEALFRDDIEANLTGGALQDSNTFRLKNCYTEVVDSVLMSRGVSLKAIFDVYASLMRRMWRGAI